MMSGLIPVPWERIFYEVPTDGVYSLSIRRYSGPERWGRVQGTDVAETTYTPFQTKPDAAPVRLIVRRVKPTPGSQFALFARYSYHGFITDRDGETLELEATTAATPRSRMRYATSSTASG